MNVLISKIYYVYMLRCSDGTLYTGMSKDVQKRMILHSKGRGAKYVKTRCPFKLVFMQEAGITVGEALKRERQIKNLKKKEKEDLIFSDCNLLIKE